MTKPSHQLPADVLQLFCCKLKADFNAAVTTKNNLIQNNNNNKKNCWVSCFILKVLSSCFAFHFLSLFDFLFFFFLITWILFTCPQCIPVCFPLIVRQLLLHPVFLHSRRFSLFLVVRVWMLPGLRSWIICLCKV